MRDRVQEKIEDHKETDSTTRIYSLLRLVFCLTAGSHFRICIIYYDFLNCYWPVHCINVPNVLRLKFRVFPHSNFTPES